MTVTTSGGERSDPRAWSMQSPANGITVYACQLALLLSLCTETSALRTITPSQFLDAYRNGIAHAVLPNGIPKVLHQASRVWKTEPDGHSTPLPVHQEFVRSWERYLGDDWLRVVWTDDPIDAFVAAHASAEFLRTYQSYIHVIQRVDAFRYVLLSAFGGVYSDMDNECLRLPVFNQSCEVFLAAQALDSELLAREQREQFLNSLQELQHWGLVYSTGDYSGVNPVQNSLLASAPNHPFWTTLLELAIRRGPQSNFVQRWSGFQLVHYTTGVDLLGAAHILYNYRSQGKTQADLPTNVCELGWQDWHGSRAKSDSKPLYVLHHGTHTWDAKRSDMIRATKQITTLAMIVLGVTAMIVVGPRRIWQRAYGMMYGCAAFHSQIVEPI